MTSFCPICWKEIAPGEARCPHCGGEITEFDRGDFKEKLFHALGHPVPETVRVAVFILGRLKCGEAIKPLTDLFERTDNPLMRMEILEAMERISNEGIVKRKARELLEKSIQ